jgi:hypothetical protein
MTTTTHKPPRTEPLRSYPEDADTPPPFTSASADAKPPEAQAKAPEAQPDPFEFKDGKAYAKSEEGNMVEVELEKAQAAASHSGNDDPAIRLRAAASLVRQYPVKAKS